MRILLVGDVHGHIDELAKYLTTIKSLFRIGAAIQLGDFGFFPDIFRIMQEDGPYFSVPLYAIDGNHEDHDWLFDAGENDQIEKWKNDHNLFYLPRGSIVTIAGTKIGAIGGALHVDRPQEFTSATQTSNYILQKERQAAAELFNREQPELIVSHSCPTGIGIGIKTSNMFDQTIAQHIVQAGFDPGISNDCGDRELTNLWKALNYRPKAWAFGHFHIDHEKIIEGTKFVCNNCFDKQVKSQIVVWDTEERCLFTLKF